MNDDDTRIEDPDGAGDSGGGGQGDPDYKSLYEGEKSAREAEEARRVKEEAIIQANTKKPKGLGVDEVKSVVDEALGKFTANFQKKELDREIALITSDEERAKRIRHHLENTIRVSGDIQLDVANAAAIEGRDEITRKAQEIEVARQSEETKSQGDVSGRKSESDVPQLGLTPADQLVIADMRKTYVIPDNVIPRILKGENFSDLIAQGVIKKI